MHFGNNLGKKGYSFCLDINAVVFIFAERLQCPSSEYTYNPYSNTCVRLIKSQKQWEDAQNYCAIRGEYLVTLETLESAFWFRFWVKVNPGIGRC